MNSIETSDIENTIREITIYLLAMSKHCFKYKPDFNETIEEDARHMFNILKEVYEEGKHKNASYTPKLEKIINNWEKYFD